MVQPEIVTQFVDRDTSAHLTDQPRAVPADLTPPSPLFAGAGRVVVDDIGEGGQVVAGGRRRLVTLALDRADVVARRVQTRAVRVGRGGDREPLRGRSPLRAVRPYDALVNQVLFVTLYCCCACAVVTLSGAVQ